MKTYKLSSLLVLASLALLMACTGKTADNSAKEENKAESSAKETKGKYAIKSGVVVYNTQVMGMDVKQTLTFDDYGNKEVQEMEMEVMGTPIHTLTLAKDGYIYTIDLVNRTATKVPGMSVNSSSIDFENLSDEMVQKMNLKKIGTEEMLGKKCDKMSIDYTDMQMTGTFLVYKGVALKMETEVSTMAINLVAESFEENPDIDASKFEIPSDITINEN